MFSHRCLRNKIEESQNGLLPCGLISAIPKMTQIIGQVELPLAGLDRVVLGRTFLGYRSYPLFSQKILAWNGRVIFML
jgi:hypothetical protein